MTDGGRDDAGARDGLDVAYEERGGERRIVFRTREGGAPRVTVASPTEGYGMLVVRRDGAEVERYYGLDMALDHAAELLDVPAGAIPVPDEAGDMGM